MQTLVLPLIINTSLQTKTGDTPDIDPNKHANMAQQTTSYDPAFALLF